MLDPLTAFGVAANVVQFVDFGIKLVSASNQLYKNQILVEHKELREQANQLVEFSEILKKRVLFFRHADQVAETSRLEGQSHSNVESRDEIESLLRSALNHSTTCAEELLGTINKLTVSGRHAKWQSIRIALSSLLGESGIEKTTQKLFQAQQNVQLFLLLYTSANSTSRVLNSQQSLEKTLLQAINDTTHKFEEQIRQLETAFTQTEKYTTVETENAESRDYSIELVEEFVRKSQNSNPSLFNDVDENIVHVLPVFAQERFLRTLDFHQIEDRYDRIDVAHKETLQWILRPNEQPGDANDSFATWLATVPESSNVYWVTGVPGSGKSTLMRFLSDAPQVKEVLRQNQDTLPVVVLRCFFWHPGTELQKSMEGLLRTLIHQAIIAGGVEDSTLQKSCPMQWQSCLYDRMPTSKWPIDDLKALFGGIIGPLSQCNNVIVFIDGLDEYGADRKERQELVDYLLEVKRHSRAKMCLSSRPWNEFKDKLGSCPHFKLEDINKRDMKVFVETKLAGNPAFQELAMVANDQVADLFEQLVVKSSGVFLWLRLVTRRLQNAAEEGKPLRKLKEILDEIPPDLDEFFKHMLERIDQHERVQASKIFQIVVDPSETYMPDLMMLSFTDEQDHGFALSAAIEAETAPEILSRTIALRRRIDSHCMDLLICPQQRSLPRASPAYQWDYIQIEYLHRTVRDFLISPTSLEVLRSFTIRPLDVSWYKCNATLAQMLFLRKFITASLPPTLAQCSTQIALFSTCMRNLCSSDHAEDPATRSTFESALDNLEPLLLNWKDEQLDREDFETKYNMYNDELARNTPFTSTRSWSICRTYCEHKYKLSGTCRYLLMALLVELREFSRHYLTDVRDSYDIWGIFQCTLDHIRSKSRSLDLELLALLAERGSSLEDIPAAFTILNDYHDIVAMFDCGAESAAKVTRLLLGKLIGIVRPRSHLRDGRDALERRIQNTYDKRTAEALLDMVQVSSKTWKPISRSFGLGSTRASAVDQTSPPGPATGQPVVARTGPQLGTTKTKISFRQKIFGSKS